MSRFLATLFLNCLLVWPVFGADVLAPPSAQQCRQLTDDWLKVRGLGDVIGQPAYGNIWNIGDAATTSKRFDAVLQSFYLVDPEVRLLVDSFRESQGLFWQTSYAALESRHDEPFYINNIRYFHARHLTVLSLHEEALAQFQLIDPKHVIDPAGCLFHRAVCEQQLLLKEAGLKTITTLLESVEDVPARYSQVAELMKLELEGLEDKSLGEVAHQMRDVERRLALGRAGERVQQVEERIINTLDEIIKKLEAQQGGGGGGAGGGASSPEKAAQDSYIGGIKGEGQVDPKKLGHKDNWGNLPPKEQAAAKNLLDRQFPPHYRQAVEEYLKKLAERKQP